MAKVTHLHDLVRRQFEQLLALDACGNEKTQAKIAGRARKVINKLVDLEWEAMLRPTNAPDTFSVGYGEDNQ